MSKFVTLDEAAQLLGMTTDELVEARSSGEVHGYRDGSSWKFKAEEIERFASERGSELPGGGASDAGGDLGSDELRLVGGEADVEADKPAESPAESSEDELSLDPLSDYDADDAVLLSDADGGVSEAASSTIIGAGGQSDGAESDIRLASAESDLTLDDSPLELDSDSEVLGSSEPPKTPGAGDSDVQLVADEDGSDVRVVPGSGSGILGGSGTDELKLDVSSGSGTGELVGGTGSSDLGLGSSELLDDDDEEVLSLSDEDDLVLAGSGTGSDVTMGGSDTGINLTNPSDSGLLLDDDALDLGSVSSLELPEDEEEDALGSVDDADGGVQQEEDFNLGPTEVAAEPEDDEGSSQVIKLEQDAFGTDDLTDADPLAEGVGFEEVTDDEEAVLVADDVEGLETAGVAVGRPAEDISFSAVNIAWLSCVTLVLALSGILMIDVVRNMWSWNEATANSLASGIMEGIVSAVGMNR